MLERGGVVYRGRSSPRRSRDELLAAVRPDWRAQIEMARAGRVAARARRLAVVTH